MYFSSLSHIIYKNPLRNIAGKFHFLTALLFKGLKENEYKENNTTKFTNNLCYSTVSGNGNTTYRLRSSC